MASWATLLKEAICLKGREDEVRRVSSGKEKVVFNIGIKILIVVIMRCNIF